VEQPATLKLEKAETIQNKHCYRVRKPGAAMAAQSW